MAKKGQTSVEVYEVYSMDFENIPGEIYQSERQMVGFTNFDVVVSDPSLDVNEQTTKFYLPSTTVDYFTEVKPANKGKKDPAFLLSLVKVKGVVLVLLLSWL